MKYCKTYEEAKEWGDKHYLRPEIKETENGTFRVTEEFK